MKIEYKLETEFIELFKLLKLLNLTESGGQAKALIADGQVLVNGTVETRKAFKVRPGHQIQFGDDSIDVL